MSFGDIKGQDGPVLFLRRAIGNNTVAHAYLFAGADGVGKHLAATNFAKALNCEKKAPDACDVCASCRKIDGKNHPDICRISPAAPQALIKIDAIRNLGEKVSLRPYEAEWKVFIIEDAHLLTPEAANCLLKTLEEPPGDSVLILTSSNASRLFQTIVSRCRVIRFSPLSSEVIEDIYIKKFGFRKSSAGFLSRFSNGSMSKRAVLEGEGLIAWKNKVVDEFMSGDFFRENSPMLSSAKEDLREALSVLINWYRDILVRKNGASGDSIIHFDRIEDITAYAGALSFRDIDRRLNMLIDAHMAVGQNVNPKLAIGALI